MKKTTWQSLVSLSLLLLFWHFFIFSPTIPFLCVFAHFSSSYCLHIRAMSYTAGEGMLTENTLINQLTAKHLLTLWESKASSRKINSCSFFCIFQYCLHKEKCHKQSHILDNDQGN